MPESHDEVVQRARDLLRRREELKTQPDPFPPVQSRPLGLLPEALPVDDAGSKRDDQRAPSASSHGLPDDLVDVASTSGDFSDVSSLGDGPLARLALNEGLGAPTPQQPTSAPAAINRDVSPVSRHSPGDSRSMMEWRSLANATTTPRSPGRARFKRSPPRNEGVDAVRQLETMQREYAAAMAEIGRLKEVRNKAAGTPPPMSSEDDRVGRRPPMPRHPATTPPHLMEPARRGASIIDTTGHSDGDGDDVEEAPPVAERRPVRTPPGARRTAARAAERHAGMDPAIVDQVNELLDGGSKQDSKQASRTAPSSRSGSRRPVATRSVTPPARSSSASRRKPGLPQAARGVPAKFPSHIAEAVLHQAEHRQATPPSRPKVQRRTNTPPPTVTPFPPSRIVKREPKQAAAHAEATAPARRSSPQRYGVSEFDYTRQRLQEHARHHREQQEALRADAVVSSDAAELFRPPASEQRHRRATAASAAKTPRGHTQHHHHPAAHHPVRSWSPAPTSSRSATPQRDAHRPPTVPLRNDDGVTTSPWSNLPLAAYVTSVLTAPVHRLRHELDVAFSASDVRYWLAMTALLNQPTVLKAVVVPVLTTQLRSRDAAASRERTNNILCCLAGLGHVAADALPVLVEMLLAASGDRKLVALALRCVGGHKAIDELVRIIASNPSAATKGAAAYALGLMAEARPGHTAVLCVNMGPAAKQQQLSLIRLGVDDHVDASARDRSPPRRTVGSLSLKLKEPDYVPTHAVLDFGLVMRHLQQYLASSRAQQSAPYPALGSVLTTFCSSLALLAEHAALTQSAETLASGLRSQLSSIASSSPLSSAQLEGSYASLQLGQRHREGVVDALVHQLGVDTAQPAVQEQVLLALAALPRTMTAPTLGPLMRLARGRLARGPTVLAATAVTVATLAAHHTDKPAQRAAVEWLTELVLHKDSNVRHCAVEGLAILRGDAVSAASIVYERWFRDSALEADAAMNCLAALGDHGLKLMLTLLCDTSHPPSFRGKVALHLRPPHVSKSFAGPVTEALAGVIANEVAEDDLIPDALESYALLAVAPHAVPLRDNEEAAPVATRCPRLPALDSLTEVMVHPAASAGVRRVAADVIARHGGAVAEVALLQLLLKHDDALVRACAASGLVHTGASPCVGLLLAANDTDELVRNAALQSLDEIGLPDILAALRGPQASKARVALRCCTDYLRYSDDDLIRNISAACEDVAA